MEILRHGDVATRRCGDFFTVFSHLCHTVNPYPSALLLLWLAINPNPLYNVVNYREMAEMRFLADTMLGRLATWLRLLGYDTAFRPELDDGGLARVARAEDRVLLTRDVELTRRRGLLYELIESDKIAEQLEQVFKRFGLHAREAFSRCAECNVPLDEASKESVRGSVPPYVFQTMTRFRRCPRCQRVYWRGTHWARMLAQMEDIEMEQDPKARP